MTWIQITTNLQYYLHIIYELQYLLIFFFNMSMKFVSFYYYLQARLACLIETVVTSFAFGSSSLLLLLVFLAVSDQISLSYTRTCAIFL